MKRALLAAILALLPTVALSEPSPSVVARAENASVIVTDRMTDPLGNVTYAKACSGFVVAADRTFQVVATAAHCAAANPDGSLAIPTVVHFFDGDWGRVYDEKYDHPHDVMLLFVKTTRNHDAVVDFSERIHVAERFFLIGMPDGQPWSYGEAFSTQGMARNDSDDDLFDNHKYYGLGAVNVYHGSSGGAVFDASGRVVGMLDCGQDENPSIMWMVPAEDVVAFLDRALTRR